MNIVTDLELMFNTFRILFSKESTEGVENATAWMGKERSAITEEECYNNELKKAEEILDASAHIPS